MSSQKKSTCVEYLKVTEFGGIDRSSLFCKKPSAKIMENFRLTPDGSLLKRGGFQHKVNLPIIPRYIWSAVLCGEQEIFIVTGSSVYKVEADSGISYYIGALSNNNKKVNFIFYDEEVFIFDGVCIFKYSPTGTFSEVSGYVPIYGDGWHPINMGEIKEPFNMISPYVIIRYNIKEAPSRINIGFKALEIESASFDGGGVPNSSQITLSADGTFLNCNFTESNCVLSVCLIRDGYQQSNKNVCYGSGAFVSTDSKGSKIYTYGGDNKPVVCSSRHVTESQVRYSKTLFSLSDNIYFPFEDCQYVDGGAKISAVCCIYDMLFIFTENCAYAKSTESYDKSITLINATVGCSSQQALLAIGDELYTVCKDGIYKWNTAISPKGRVSATLISQPIKELIDEDFSKNTKIYHCANKNELWFTLPNNKLLIYNTVNKAFYNFTNINNSLMFYYYDDIAFAINKKVFTLSNSQVYDLDESLNTVDITAKYKSNYIDFLGFNVKKRVAKLSLLCETKNKDLSISFNSDSGSSVSLNISGEDYDYPQIIKRRLPLGRFSFMSFLITSDERAQQQIYSLTISANAEKK